MIYVDLPSRMRCDTTDCEATSRVELVLNSLGAFAFRPVAKDWQIRLSAPGAPYRTLCPKHAQLLDAPKVTLHG